MIRERVLAAGLAGVLVSLAWPASAQVIVDSGTPTSYPAPEWLERLMPDADDPYWQAYAAQKRAQREKELELRRFRKQYFGQGVSDETRQVGMALIRERYDSPALYPLLLETFEHDDGVRVGLLDMFADAASEEGDAALAWEAVFAEDGTIRDEARERLVARVGALGEVPQQVKLVVGAGLQKTVDSEVVAAAGLAEMFKLYEMVPLMIAAQVGTGGNQGGAREGTGNLGWIIVAQQQAFVSDLQPVVSDSAVGFDPTLSLVTEGVVLEVNDAVVITYRTEVFYSLTRMTSDALGTPTGAWGMDQDKWWAWYERDWKPWMADRAARS